MTLVALLMRVWVAEAGWSAAADHAAIAAVLLADDRGLAVAVERRVDVHSRALARHPWLLELDPACAVPVAWERPARAWPAGACMELAARGRQALSGRLRARCERLPDGWRAHRSKALGRALRRGCERVWCGRTKNVFLLCGGS